MNRDPLSLCLLLPLVLVACGDKDGDEDDGGGDDGTATVCIDEDLGSSLEMQLASADVEGDDYQGTCDGQEFGEDAPDWGWTWTAPTTTGYTFTTDGSEFDTVLVIHDGDCNGPVLGCNDDLADDNTDSSVYVELTEGQVVTIVVDGLDAYANGEAFLRVFADL